jgi:hypothetical protein
MKESTLTPEHLAAKLLAGCPPGPVYEYLLTAAGKQAAKTVTVAPTEDETTWALLRGLDVDTACRLISLITSPELLHRILAMARRKNVRRAIAANPHLTDADVTTLAHEAALADKALAQALYEGRTPAGQVKLLHVRCTTPRTTPYCGPSSATPAGQRRWRLSTWCAGSATSPDSACLP